MPGTGIKDLYMAKSVSGLNKLADNVASAANPRL